MKIDYRELQARLEAAAEPFFRGIVRYRVFVLVAGFAATVLFATWLPQLRLDPDTEAYVPKHHPIRVFWQEARDRFGIGREILVAVEAEGPDGIFTAETLAAIDDLTEGIKALEGVIETDVRSIADSDAIIGTADGLDFEPFYDAPPSNAEESQAVRRKIFDNPVYLDRLVSRDASIAAIVVQTHHTAADVAPTEMYRRIAAYTEAHPIAGARILIAGNPAVEYWYGRQMAADLARLIPLALLAVVAILFVCFRSTALARIALRAAVLAALAVGVALARGSPIAWGTIGLAATGAAMLTTRAVLLPSVVVAATVVWTWGFQAMLGLPVYIAGTMVPPLLLAIGCASGIHILERYYEHARKGGVRDAVVVSTMVELWRPIVLTSVTTAAGFGSLTIGRMTVYQVFGLTTAFGILVSMLMSLTVLPAALAVMPLPRERSGSPRRERIPSLLAGLGAAIERRRVLVVAGGLAVAAFMTVSAGWLRVDYSWVESLEDDTPVLEADRVLRERHGGTMPLNVIVRAAEDDGIKDPALLRAVDTVLERLSEHPYVGDTRSIAEYIERMNEAMNENRPEELRIPDDRNLIAQYLLLFSMSSDPTELDDMVDYEYRAANLAVLLRSDRMQIMDDVIARAESLLDEHIRPLGATATITGSAMIQDTVLDLILTSQVYSLATAATLVFACMWLLFRSLTHALLCMLGPAFTALVNFGAMGLFGVPLGPDKAMVSAVALGIGIDYSIHLMSRFRDLTERGVGVDEAIVESMRTTGRAILFNGLVVVAGFAVLGASRSPSNAVFGWMIAANMAVACIAALTLMPAALTILGHLDSARAVIVRIRGRLVHAHHRL